MVTGRTGAATIYAEQAVDEGAMQGFAARNPQALEIASSKVGSALLTCSLQTAAEPTPPFR